MKNLVKLPMSLFSNGSKFESLDVSWDIILVWLTAERLCEVSYLCEPTFIPKSLFISDDGKLHARFFFYFSMYLHMTSYLEQKFCVMEIA